MSMQIHPCVQCLWSRCVWSVCWTGAVPDRGLADVAVDDEVRVMVGGEGGPDGGHPAPAAGVPVPHQGTRGGTQVRFKLSPN